MKDLKVIAFTHKTLDLKLVGKLVIGKENLPVVLTALQQDAGVSEIFYVSTCNRVEFVFTSGLPLSLDFVSNFLNHLPIPFSGAELQEIIAGADLFESEEALVHLMRVSGSLESLVLGEKEILVQVRQAYEQCREWGFTADFMRVVMNRVVKTSKEIYTHTKIAEKPVSVVSIAHRKLKSLHIKDHTRFLLIGAGETNQLFAKYLKKQQYGNFVVFNRTLEKAEALAKELGGKALPLQELGNYREGFDVIITCTGATEALITPAIYHSLLNGEQDTKVILDLAVPNDTHPEVLKENVHFIDIGILQEIVKKNIDERSGELVHAEQIIAANVEEFRPVLRQRRVEIAMQIVPQKIREIRDTALSNVFAADIQQLDHHSKEVLDKILNYMEKKYISIPMVMAKEILVKE